MIDEVSFNVSDMLVWCKRVRRHAGEHVVRFELAAGQPSATVFDREQWCEARTPFVDIPQLGNPNTHWFAPIDLLIDALSAASAVKDAGGTLMVDHDENMLRFVGGGVTASLPLMAEQAWWSPPKRCDGKVGATLGQLAAVMGFARDESINLELAVVRCEHDAIVATDLQRIGWIETTTQLGSDDHVSVPAASVKLADTFLPPEAEVWMGDGAWSAEWRGDRFVGTPVMAQFPNWRSVVDHMVPDNPEAAGRRPFMVAGDTYRPAAVDQLVTLARQTNIPYYEEGTSASPPDICARGVEAARKADATVVLLDTAGRLQIDDEMMDELVAIRERTQPAEILLVADAMTGQEAVRIAEGFNQRVGLTGLILTKVDGDARGGAAISMRAVTGVPIKFMGTGEKLDGLEPFHPDRLASRILGMGDVLTLIERAEELFDEREAERLQRKLLKNQFTLEDFLKQLQQIKRMGSVGQILDMLPGMGRLRQQINIDNEEAQKQLKKVEAIIYSMTPGERRNPKLLNARRKQRIAAGSGTSVQDINALLRQFREMQRMMQMIGRGNIPRIPGLFK